MDDLLKRLLDAELQGEAIAEEANWERERMVQQAAGRSRRRFSIRSPRRQAASTLSGRPCARDRSATSRG